MTPEFESGSRLSIKDPRRFLRVSYDSLRDRFVRRLARPPNLGLLRWMPNLTDEHGLYFDQDQWFVVHGQGFGTSINMPPEFPLSGESIMMHTHPSKQEGFFRLTVYEGSDDGSCVDVTSKYCAYPSPGDFRMSSRLSIQRTFVISDTGITRFWPGTADERAWDYLEILWPGIRVERYEQLIKDVGAGLKIIPWDELNEEKLNQLFYH